MVADLMASPSRLHAMMKACTIICVRPASEKNQKEEAKPQNLNAYSKYARKHAVCQS